MKGQRRIKSIRVKDDKHCLCREGRMNQQINERETDKKRAKERAAEREREGLSENWVHK